MASKFLKNLASPKFKDMSVTFRQHESEPGKIIVRFSSGKINKDDFGNEYVIDESDLDIKVNTMDSWLSVMLLESKVLLDTIAGDYNE